MRRNISALVMSALLVGACGSFGSATDTGSQVADGGPDGATDGGDASLRSCGWKPFEDGFELDTNGTWGTVHAPYGPQGKLQVAPSMSKHRGGANSLLVTIEPDTDTRAFSFEHAVTGPGAECVDVTLWLAIDKSPTVANGGSGKDVLFAALELDDTAILFGLTSNNRLAVTEEGAPTDGGKKPFASSNIALPLGEPWNEVAVHFERSASGARVTVTVNGTLESYDLQVPHPGTPVVRVGCRFAAADVSARYFIDDVSIR